ncbi:hypothetical protein [Clostridium sp.]|uniref:hypothetical protein n=1 Tax=Clostridium sp. TaxID=1506 RepID=UPI003F39C9E5
MGNTVLVENGIDNIEDRKKYMSNDNIKILESVKNIVTLSNCEFITVGDVCSYFDITKDALDTLIKENRSELLENGMVLLTGKELREELVTWNISVTNYRGYFTADGYKFANRSNILMSKRCLLNVGMLLRDSKVAKELRRRILDVMYDAEDGNASIEVVANEIADEQCVFIELGEALMNGDISKVLECNAKLMEMKNKRIVELENKNEELEETLTEIVENNITFDEFSRKCGKLISMISNELNTNKRAIWMYIYEFLKYQPLESNNNRGIDVHARQINLWNKANKERIDSGKPPYAKASLQQMYPKIKTIKENEYQEVLEIIKSYAVDKDIDIRNFNKLI